MMALEKALYSKLAGDTGAGGVATLAIGGIHRILAPQGTSAPYVVFQKFSAVQQYTFTLRDHTRYVYMVKAIAEDRSSAIADQIDNRVDAILTDGTLPALSGFTLIYMRRSSDLPPLIEVGEGRTYQHVGGLYDILVG
jgi:hypothetical protein